MKGTKLILCAVCAVVTVIAAITAIIIFRNEIVYFLTDMKEKLEEKKWFSKNGEFSDYADV